MRASAFTLVLFFCSAAAAEPQLVQPGYTSNPHAKEPRLWSFEASDPPLLQAKAQTWYGAMCGDPRTGRCEAGHQALSAVGAPLTNYLIDQLEKARAGGYDGLSGFYAMIGATKTDEAYQYLTSRATGARDLAEQRSAWLGLRYTDDARVIDFALSGIETEGDWMTCIRRTKAATRTMEHLQIQRPDVVTQLDALEASSNQPENVRKAVRWAVARLRNKGLAP